MNTVVTQVMDQMFRSCELDELFVFDSHIPREYQQWLPRVKEDFNNFSGNNCRVSNLLVKDGLIRRTPDTDSALVGRYRETTNQVVFN